MKTLCPSVWTLLLLWLHYRNIITGQYFELCGIDWLDLFEEPLLKPHKDTLSCVFEFVESLLWKSHLMVQEFFSQCCTSCPQKKQLISATCYTSDSKCCCSYGQRPAPDLFQALPQAGLWLWISCAVTPEKCQVWSQWAVTSGREGCRSQCWASQSLLLRQEMEALPDTPMQGEMLRWCKGIEVGFLWSLSAGICSAFLSQTCLLLTLKFPQ